MFPQRYGEGHGERCLLTVFGEEGIARESGKDETMTNKLTEPASDNSPAQVCATWRIAPKLVRALCIAGNAVKSSRTVVKSARSLIR